MKKKLEAELISIAHRILKMKNRSELDQLQAETLKLYEKLSVLKFVEDNFADIKPTIGYASAEGKLEEIYGIEEVPEVHANEVEAAEEKARAEKKPASDKTDDKNEDDLAKERKNAGDGGNKTDDIKQDKKNESGEGVTAGKEQAPVAETEKEETEVSGEMAKPEGDADPNQKIEEYQASEEEKEHTEKETDEEVEEAPEEEAPAPVAEPEKTTEEPKQEAAPEKKEEPAKQKEITFEDYHDYKEPEFVKKIDVTEPVNVQKEWLPKEPEVIQKQEEKAQEMWEEPKKEEPKAQEPAEDDWRNWEPNKSQPQSQPADGKKEEPKAEPDDWRNWEPNKQSQPADEKKEESKPAPAAPAAPAAPRPLNDSFGKTITLGLNDRIAFEKNLFGGSSEDLNRVISQINTQNSFDEARAFIEDLVKPDYNNWSGKEEYETRFMELVEKRFS